jgi:hypothetical protein
LQACIQKILKVAKKKKTKKLQWGNTIQQQCSKHLGKEPIFKKKGATYGMWKKVCLVTVCISQKNLLQNTYYNELH